MNVLVKQSLIVLLVVMFAFAPVSILTSNSYATENKASFGSVVVDAIVLRPLGLCSTILGATFFVITLPFAALGNNINNSAEAMVITPAKYTFARPIGEF